MGRRIEDLYGMPMDIGWARAGGKLFVVQARPITSLPEPPLEWISPFPKTVLMRQSFAEFVPNPVSPLFATMGVPIASHFTQILFHQFMPWMDLDSLTFSVVNHYVYIGLQFNLKNVWNMGRGVMAGQMGKMLRTGQARWSAMREKYHDIVIRWQNTDLCLLSPVQLLRGAREIFEGTAEYYTAAQSGPIPSHRPASAFSRFYKRLLKRKTDPAASTFLLGLDNFALRAEKALFTLAQSLKNQPELTRLILNTPVDDVCAALQDGVTPEGQPPAWLTFLRISSATWRNLATPFTIWTFPNPFQRMTRRRWWGRSRHTWMGKEAIRLTASEWRPRSGSRRPSKYPVAWPVTQEMVPQVAQLGAAERAKT